MEILYYWNFEDDFSSFPDSKSKRQTNPHITRDVFGSITIQRLRFSLSWLLTSASFGFPVTSIRIVNNSWLCYVRNLPSWHVTRLIMFSPKSFVDSVFSPDRRFALPEISRSPRRLRFVCCRRRRLSLSISGRLHHPSAPASTCDRCLSALTPVPSALKIPSRYDRPIILTTAEIRVPLVWPAMNLGLKYLINSTEIFLFYF